jgi:hypothetical protein
MKISFKESKSREREVERRSRELVLKSQPKIILREGATTQEGIRM